MPPERGVARTALLLWVAALLGGCAGHVPVPANPAARSAPSTATDHAGSERGTPTVSSGDAVATAPATGRDEVEAARRRWPDPETDLWSQIRAGFGFDADSDRLRVRRWTQRFATHQNDLKAALERAQPYLWHVVQRIDERDLPTELALLPIVESGYDPTARSYKGATGLWQFMPGTADHMGLTRDWWYDARNDVIASTEAALDYLDQLQRRYDGDWLLALAAYNAGPGRVDRAIARARAAGEPDSYWHLELPAETSDYVPKLLALRRVMNTPHHFGMTWPTLDNAPRTRAVRLPGQTDLGIAADMLGMSESQLRQLNPGMRRWASAPRSGTSLLVPAGKAATFRRKLARTDPSALVERKTHIVQRGDVLSRLAQRYGVSVAALRQANHLRSDRIRVGQALQIPQTGRGPERPSPSGEPSETYVVQAGDSLWEIAQRYRVGVRAMRASNPGLSSTIRPGQKLTIPGSATPPEPATHVVRAGDSLWRIARANDITIADLRRWNRLDPSTRLHPGQELAIDGPAPLPDFYEVEPGDSLWSIAARFSMQVTTLRSLNDMSSGSTIRPGQRLRLQPSVSAG